MSPAVLIPPHPCHHSISLPFPLSRQVLGFYHAPWCVHSQNVVEDVARASRMLEARDGAIMGINCELPEFGELCNELEIEGYPTFLLHRCVGLP